MSTESEPTLTTLWMQGSALSVIDRIERRLAALEAAGKVPGGAVIVCDTHSGPHHEPWPGGRPCVNPQPAPEADLCTRCEDGKHAECFGHCACPHGTMPQPAHQPAPAVTPAPAYRCTLCGSGRVKMDDGTYGSCSLIGCTDPLHDWRPEEMVRQIIGIVRRMQGADERNIVAAILARLASEHAP